jgi:hypothetical protein
LLHPILRTIGQIRIQNKKLTLKNSRRDKNGIDSPPRPAHFNIILHKNPDTEIIINITKPTFHRYLANDLSISDANILKKIGKSLSF